MTGNSPLFPRQGRFFPHGPLRLTVAGAAIFDTYRYEPVLSLPSAGGEGAGTFPAGTPSATSHSRRASKTWENTGRIPDGMTAGKNPGRGDSE